MPKAMSQLTQRNYTLLVTQQVDRIFYFSH